MFELFFKIYLSILTNYYSVCQSTIHSHQSDLFKLNRLYLFIRYKRIDQYTQPISRNFFIMINESLLFSETTTNVSIILNKEQNSTNKLKKILIIFLIFIGSIILVSITIILAIIYANWSRPSRIHEQIPIEYLNSNEMINYLEESSSRS